MAVETAPIPIRVDLRVDVWVDEFIRRTRELQAQLAQLPATRDGTTQICAEHVAAAPTVKIRVLPDPHDPDKEIERKAYVCSVCRKPLMNRRLFAEASEQAIAWAEAMRMEKR